MAPIPNSVVKKVDLHCRDNNTAHHTNEIREDQLIVRRGQSFTVTLDLEKPFDAKRDSLTLVAETGPKPEEKTGTKSVMCIPKSTASSAEAISVWKAEFHQTQPSQSPGGVALTVTPPADAPIGQWSLSMKTSLAQDANAAISLGKLFLLFNPWFPEDAVYLANEEERQEYVTNEQGRIYKGTKHFINPLAWDFGQFEEDMVDICLKMLDVNPKYVEDSAQDVAARSDPVYVGRLISAMINSEDDRGVLHGKWEGKYSEGLPPTHWRSSVDILRRWYASDCQAVKYGQCWVFAGVMCSVMRCLGIPCRVVTNFSSACDSDMNLIIDKCYNADGPMENEDSVWNFHVWTEGWMKRPDLSADGSYDGWQVLDPTPQELSDGVHCCGPASVKAIYHGNVDLKYDVPFVFAEVNADVIKWMVAEDGTKSKMSCNSHRVGRNISTKCVGSDDRQDITHTYKPEEGSEIERDIFKHASAVTCLVKEEEEKKKEAEAANEEGAPPSHTVSKETTKPTDKYEPQDVLMVFKEEKESVNGQDICLKLELSSEDQVARTFSIQINVQAKSYMGKRMAKVHSQLKEGLMEPRKVLSIPIAIPFSMYRSFMTDYDSLRVSVIATDKQDPACIYEEETDIVPQDPPFIFTVQGKPRQHAELVVVVRFTNPIAETLTGCTMSLSGSGLLKTEVEQSVPDLQPGEQAKVTITMFPYKVGMKSLGVNFTCSAFRDIKASHDILVKPAESATY